MSTKKTTARKKKHTHTHTEAAKPQATKQPVITEVSKEQIGKYRQTNTNKNLTI